MKILAVFPELVNRGGAERGLGLLAKYFKMDVLTNHYAPEKTFDDFKKVNVIEWKLPNKTAFCLKLASTKFSGYDMFLSYGYFATNLIALRNHPTIWYCHTPHREFHEPFRTIILKEMRNPLKRFLKTISTIPAAHLDKFLANKIDVLTCNSENIQSRIRLIYKKNAIITYGPVDTKSFWSEPPEDYYLCHGRIEKVKRIDLVVRAFNKMPNKKLTISGSAKDKNYLKYLKELSGKNITILQDVPDSELKRLYAKCIAVICVPILEDFGLVPTEAMASGKPCIGANEGGLKETIIDGKTGLLIDPTEENLIAAVKFITSEKAKKMRSACEKRAKIFSKEKFIERMGNVFRDVCKSNVK